MIKGGIKAMFSEVALTETILKVATQQLEDNALQVLQYCGESAVAYARNNGDYINRTGNLRNSIGYIIALDGKAVTDAFEVDQYGTVNTTGALVGRQLALRVIGELNFGWTLVVVAGMEYASAVEATGRDVLSGSSVFLKDFMQKLLDEFSNV